MAKLSRSVLKGIVKECMVEIMSEAFFPIPNSQMNERLNESRNVGSNYKNVTSDQYSTVQQSDSHPSPRGSYLDNISFGAESKKENPNFQNNVSRVTQNMTKDPVLADILKDTAMTTLQEQASAEKGKPMVTSGGGKPRCLAYFHGGPNACPHNGGKCSGWHVTSDQYFKTGECNIDKEGEVCKRGAEFRFRHKTD